VEVIAMTLRSSLLGAAAAVALFAQPAAAQKSADTLRIVVWDQIPDVDPYYNELRAGLVVHTQAFDGLLARDPETFTVKGALATAWKYIDDTTIEFTLRKGVTFHDGSPFSADDVVYTLNGILTDKLVSVPSNYAWMAGAEKVDDYTVRVKLKQIFPAATEYLSMVTPIWPKASREKAGKDGYSRQPIGAGPYKITKVDGSSWIEMERYEGYYQGSPKGRPNIRRVVFHQVADATTAMNELLGNKADWTWNFIPDNFDNVSRMPNLQAMRAETMRVNFLGMDAAGRSGADNPMTKVKVRQAIAHAIDRQAIADKLIQGGARVPDTSCYPTQFGCDAAAAVHYGYDPAKAKALLAEAGYPNGFETEIVSYFIPPVEGAVQNYLRAVGINAKITHLQVSAAIRRTMDGSAPLTLMNWGSYSINDVSAILPYFFGGTTTDQIRDPEITALVKAGSTSTDPVARKTSYSAAIKRITENADILPLYTSVTTYGFSKQLDFKPYPDELPRFYLAKWK
jgi:peptide/nickel transport system substrate-binding protein